MCDNKYLSSSTPHRRIVIFTVLTLWKRERGPSGFLWLSKDVFLSLLMNLSHLSLSVSRGVRLWSCTHWLSPLFPSQECSDSGWQVEARCSEVRPDGCNQTQTKQLELLLLFFFFSLTLSPHLCHLFCFSASPSMLVSVLHSCLFVEKKQKRRKMLSFLFVFFFPLFSVGFSFSCISYAMKPFTHAPSVSFHPSLFPCYGYYDSITMVNDNLTAWGSCSKNPWCSHGWHVLGPFQTGDLGPALPHSRGMRKTVLLAM